MRVYEGIAIELMYHFICNIQGAEPGGRGLAVSFEQVFEQLSHLPRMFIEPDGSFVWRGTAADGEAWQVDGNLIDQGAALAYVELKGCCPQEQFEQLLTAWAGRRSGWRFNCRDWAWCWTKRSFGGGR